MKLTHEVKQERIRELESKCEGLEQRLKVEQEVSKELADALAGMCDVVNEFCSDSHTIILDETEKALDAYDNIQEKQGAKP